jgi:hypothetical protein
MNCGLEPGCWKRFRWFPSADSLYNYGVHNICQLGLLQYESILLFGDQPYYVIFFVLGLIKLFQNTGSGNEWHALFPRLLQDLYQVILAFKMKHHYRLLGMLLRVVASARRIQQHCSPQHALRLRHYVMVSHCYAVQRNISASTDLSFYFSISLYS